MITNWIFIIGMLLIGVVCYFLGLTRGISGSQHLYDEGYEAGITYCMQHYEMTEIEPMLDDLYEEQKYKKAKQLVKELDDLFEDDNVIDCGYYD